MARKKQGLEYFPLETNIMTDIKVRKLLRAHGAAAVPVYLYLLCNIYSAGYYIEADDDLAFCIAEVLNLDEAHINDVLATCMRVGLFSADMYDQHRIITSRGIQERYINIMALLRKKNGVTLYCLLAEPRPETAQNGGEIAQEYPETAQNAGKTAQEYPEHAQYGVQKKRKEKKRKERKVNTGVFFEQLLEMLGPGHEQLAADFMEVRRIKRGANTESAMALMRNEIAKAGITPLEAIKLCVQRNWLGFRAEFLDGLRRNAAPGQQPGPGFIAQQSRKFDETLQYLQNMQQNGTTETHSDGAAN